MSRTYNPIHFEDLEPKRFEDLIRGLIYDLREWMEIEATGRSGNDKAFDIRAWEKIPASDEADTDETNKWLIQCKREKQIGPKKAAEYAKAILKENGDLYGVMFVCSSDLSIDSRDAIRKVLAEGGVQEVKILSRAEIEDLLYQPKNDHLLFAFFGYSLIRRKQSAKTIVRGRLAAKRKVEKMLGSVGQRSYRRVVVRRVDDQDYPFAPKGMYKQPINKWQFLPATFYGHYYDGILLIVEQFNAYLDHQKMEYDIEDRHSEFHVNDRSAFRGRPVRKLRNSMAVHQFYRDIPNQYRYSYQVMALIPYEQIVDIDLTGDDSHTPQIFALPFDDGDIIKATNHPHMASDGHWQDLWLDKSKYKRIKYFPQRYRIKKEKPTKDDSKTTPTADSEEPFPGLNK